MRNDGEEAQKVVQDSLKVMEQKFKASWVRLYDSKSAGFSKGGNLLPEQFSDYIVAANGSSFLLEVKSSNVHISLNKCSLKSFFKPNQIAGARLWVRSGNQAYALFYPIGSEVIEVWDMLQIIPSYLEPKQNKMGKKQPVLVSSTKPAVLAATIFNLNK